WQWPWSARDWKWVTAAVRGHRETVRTEHVRVPCRELGLRGLGAAAGCGGGSWPVIRYLLGSSALWRVLLGKELRAAWQDVVDLLICATAAYQDLIVLHDDHDYATAARYVPDLRERNVADVPGN